MIWSIVTKLLKFVLVKLVDHQPKINIIRKASTEIGVQCLVWDMTSFWFAWLNIFYDLMNKHTIYKSSWWVYLPKPDAYLLYLYNSITKRIENTYRMKLEYLIHDKIIFLEVILNSEVILTFRGHTETHSEGPTGALIDSILSYVNDI